MAADSVTVRLDGEVTIDKLSLLISRFSNVLKALDSERNINVEWVLVGLDFGSAVATAQALPVDITAPEQISAMYDDYLAAAVAVARGDEFDRQQRPVLRAVADLVSIADERNPVILETADDEIMFVSPTAQSGRNIDSQSTTSLATVRGRVETLSHRTGLRFSLYELASDKSVSCYLDEGLEGTMRDAWGYIADVTGTVKRDALTGRPLSIRKVERVEVVNEGDSNGYRSARGAIRLAEASEVAVRRMRDAG